MSSRDALILAAGAAALAYGTYGAVSGRIDSATARHEAAAITSEATNTEALISEAERIVPTMPPRDTREVSPAAILQQAEKTHVHVDRVSSERGALKVNATGPLEGVLAIAGDHAATMSVTPGDGGNVAVEMELAIQPRRVAISSPDALRSALAVARRPISPANVSTALAALFRRTGADVALGSARSSPSIAFQQETPLQYLGMIKTSGGKEAGVFRNISGGHVTSAGRGERIGEWLVLRLGRDSAVLREGSGGQERVVGRM